MKVALYKDVQYGFETVSGPSLDNSQEYVRVSEFVNVEFPKLSDEETVRKQLAALDEMRGEVSRKFAAALKEIDQRKASLQALTYEGEAA